VQPVDGLGADRDQVLAPLGEQAQHHRLILHANLPQPTALRAATATDTASSASLLRPWPTDSTRTRAASLAGTSRTWSPSLTSR
jgi:hypothetical protein